MNIFVIATNKAGKHRIPLSKVVAFQAADKYVEVHTINSNQSLFLYGITEEDDDMYHLHRAPIKNDIIHHGTSSYVSLKSVDAFMSTRKTPLIRIHRNCIINTMHITSKQGTIKEGIKLIAGRDISYSVSRRHLADFNRTTRNMWHGKRWEVSA